MTAIKKKPAQILPNLSYIYAVSWRLEENT